MDLTAAELLDEYQRGRRDFSRLNLDGIALPNVTLENVSFDESSLKRANFMGAALASASFIETDLTEAWFRDAHLAACDFRAATLSAANLGGATLQDASFTVAECPSANLNHAYLDGVTLIGTSFTEASMDGMILTDVSLVDMDAEALSDARLRHVGPSYIDVRTVMRSYKHPGFKSFMIDCGIPEIFAEYMIDCAKALGDDLLHELMQSTFISYGGPDEAFARRLYDALRSHGVVVFFFPETARVGERIGDEVFSALQRHDRMILVCSRASLDRPGVLNEVQETLDREARDGGATYLIPVMLDDYLLEEWNETQPDLAKRVKSRVAADFRDPGTFDASLGRLLTALKKKTPRRRNA